MNFQYHYNLKGSSRKPLVAAASQILGRPAVYQGAPSFAYRIGGYTVDRNGSLSCDGGMEPETVRALAERLQEKGFQAENTLTVELPDARFTPEAWENLKKIVKSKETLLKKALGASQLPITKADGRISFAWFTLQGLEGEADTYARLAAAICKMAKTQKRVTATEKPAENEKLAMRLFLGRLGFIGDEYKTARKILLRNLTGNSSWKSGHPPVREEGNPIVPPNPMEAATPAEEELDGFLPAETETIENELLKTNEGDDAYGK